MFGSVRDAVKETSPDATVIYVPPPFAADAIIEAIENEIKLIVTITEGIPQRDQIRVSYIRLRSWQAEIWACCLRRKGEGFTSLKGMFWRLESLWLLTCCGTCHVAVECARIARTVANLAYTMFSRDH